MAGSRTDNAGNPVGFRITVLYYRTAPTPFVDPLDPANIGNPDRIDPDVIEDYDDLSADPLDGNYVLTRVNNNSTLIHVDCTNAATAPGRAEQRAFGQLATVPGSDGVAPMTAVEYEGNPALPPDQRTGLAALEIIDEVALLCVPDEVHPALNAANQSQLHEHAGRRSANGCAIASRFSTCPAARARCRTSSRRRDTSYAAIYYPWVRVFDPFTRDTVLVPPAGHVAGIYARIGLRARRAQGAGQRSGARHHHARHQRHAQAAGVHARQAASRTSSIRAASTSSATSAPIGAASASGARARMSSDPLWRYVNVRRLFLYVEESIDEGTQWVVFEPNDEPPGRACARRSRTS